MAVIAWLLPSATTVELGVTERADEAIILDPIVAIAWQPDLRATVECAFRCGILRRNLAPAKNEAPRDAVLKLWNLA